MTLYYFTAKPRVTCQSQLYNAMSYLMMLVTYYPGPITKDNYGDKTSRTCSALFNTGLKAGQSWYFACGQPSLGVFSRG